MKYEAIIFDLDGVICHTDKYHYLAWKQLTDKLNIYFDEQINNRLRGVSRAESFEIILERSERAFSSVEKTSFLEEKNEIYKKMLEDMTPDDVDPEVISTLNRLKESGILLGIGSSSKNAKFILRKIGLDNFFDAVSDGVGLAKTKPDPEVFLKCADMLKIEPVSCLVVEDAVVGVEAAIAASMDCAAVGDAAQQGIANYDLKGFGELVSVVNGAS